MPTNTTTATDVATFEVGTTYSARSACDSNCVWHFTVEARTAKTVKLRHHSPINEREVTTHRPRVSCGEETILPFGSFSMAPVIRASRPAAD